VDFSSNHVQQGPAASARPGVAHDPLNAKAVEAPPDSKGKAPAIKRLLERSTQPFVGLDHEGRLTSLNRAFSLLVGRSDEELRGRPLAEFAPAADRGVVETAVVRVRATGEPLLFEAVMVRAEGHEVPVEVALEPDPAGEGEAPGLFAFVHDLSEHKLVEYALRESEDRFRKLYDEAPVGYHEVDTEGRIVSVNRTECELLGYTREELIGRSVFDLVAEEHREAALRAFPDKVAGRLPLRPFERHVVTRDGRPLILSFEERHKHAADGEVEGLRTTVRDVTDRKRAEAALQASERRTRALFEGMEEAVFVHDTDGKILDANPAASRLLGYSRDELMGMTTADIDDPEFADGFRQRLARQLVSGNLSFEGRHRTKDGRVLPVEINSSVVQLDDRKALLAVVRDISERRALEEAREALAASQQRSAREIAAKNAALTLSEARFRQLTEGSLDGVVAADPAGLVTHFNPSAGRIFGYEVSEVVGRPLSFLMPGAFPNFSGSHRLVGQTAEVTGRRKSGDEFPVELSLAAVEVAGETQYVASLRDQTERQRMRAVLAQSEKLASIGLLSAGVAHEINNPLAYVANNLAVLERNLGVIGELMGAYESLRPSADAESNARIDALIEETDWEYVRENLPRMVGRTREGVERVARIVSNLRGLARTAPPKMEPTSVAELIENALELLRDRLRRHRIEVELNLKGVPKVVCVAQQLNQVFLNLMHNAAQAVEGAGRADGGCIRVVAALEGPSLVVSIGDNGVGISEEDLPRLFDPFFTTKSVGEGTGLGLAICHGIVTGHGGRIEVESRPGVGTNFRVFLPLTPQGHTSPSKSDSF